MNDLYAQNIQSPPQPNYQIVNSSLDPKQTQYNFQYFQNNNYINSHPTDRIYYETCPNCDRKFFQGKLKMHLKSCKPGKILKKKSSKPVEQDVISLNLPKQIIQSNESKMSKRSNKIIQNKSVVDKKNQQQSDQNQFLAEIQSDQLSIKFMKENVKKSNAQTQNPINNSLQFQISKQQTLQFNENLSLENCNICNRNFMSDRIQKHKKICAKTKKQRPVFNSKLKRLNQQQSLLGNKQNTKPKVSINKITQSKIYSKTIEPQEQTINNKEQKKKPKWKIDHQNFINSIRNMKGNNDKKNKEIKPNQNPDYVYCKFCQRKFAPNVAAIHIPKCEKILNRPKPPIDKKSNTLLKITESITKPINLKEVKSIKIQASKDLNQKLKQQEQYGLSVVSKVQSTAQFQKDLTNKDPIKLSKHINIFQKKITTQYGGTNLSNSIQTNTFAGFVKKYQDVITRATKYSNIECPHCGRKFADKAAQRHIPICQQINRFKKPEKKKTSTAAKRGNSCRLQQVEQFCTHCGFKFSLGHKYCSNCGKKRQ